MPTTCELQQGCPQAFSGSPEGYRFSVLQFLQGIIQGTLSVITSPPQVQINDTFFDVESVVDNAVGTLIAPADDTRIVGWMQNQSTHTIYVSHSPSPVPGEVNQIGPGQTYVFGTGWTTAQPLYAVNNELTTVVSRVVVSQGVPA